MDFTEIMKQKIDYCSRHTDMPMELQQKAKKLCWEYNRTSPEEKEERSRILKELLERLENENYIYKSLQTGF